MKSSNKKSTDKNIMNLNESDEDNHDEGDNDSDEEQEKNQEKITTHLFIHITLITQLVKKVNGEYPCICHNLSKEDCEKNKKDSNLENINFNVIKDNYNNINLMNNDASNIKEQNLLISNTSKINQTQQINSLNSNFSFSEKDKININQNKIINEDDNGSNINTFLEEEIVPDLEIQMTNDGKIFMKNIINKLKYLGYPTVGALFSIYIKTAEEYVYLGSDPIDPNLFIDQTLVDFDNLKIKIVSYLEDKLVKKTEKQLFDKKDANKNQKDKRTKERKIEFIVEKVNAWRRLYNGFYNENGEYTRYSLDQAAKMVGISKKSLDDYLLQLRLGRKYGFNFNQNKTKKVGILRAFVKRHRAMNQNSTNNSKNQNEIDNDKEENEDGEGDNEQQGSNDSDDSGN